MTNSTVEIPSKKIWKRLRKRLFKANFEQNRTLPSDYPESLDNFDCEIYDKTTIDKMKWPDTNEEKHASRYLVTLIKKGAQYFIDNIDGDLKLIKTEKHVLPILICSENYNSSYVCSPYAYVLLGLQSLFLIKHPFLKKLAANFLIILGMLFKKGRINKVLYINHSLLATDFHPEDMTATDIRKLQTFLQKKFPRHAFIFRSINPISTLKLQNTLIKCGFKMIASRQIYFTDVKNKDLFNTRIIKSDFKLWRDKNYEIVQGKDLTQADKTQILELYNSLSLEHHSNLNPRLNSNFIKLITEQNLLQVKALKKNGTIDGVVGYDVRHRIIYCPFFGYNKKHPENLHLYRLLSTLLLVEAKEKSDLFHQSAGASFYKKVRRAQDCIEYFGVYTNHLPFRQKCVWWIFKIFMNTLAIPFMKKY